MMEKYGTIKRIKVKEVQTEQKKQAMVCFSKEREAQKAITEITWYEGWNGEVYRNVYNKNTNGKILIMYEDKQEHNTNTKRKTEGNIKKELEKMRSDIKEIKKAIMDKNEGWLETNENTRVIQKEEIEEGNEKECEYKKKKESGTKEE